MSRPYNFIDHAGESAAMLSAVEVGLGSVLHSWHVPFAGHLLSLNQVFLLSRAVRREARGRGASERHVSGGAGVSARTLPWHISNIAAVLKSLSPAGKKLTPMLAISMQGALYSTGTVLLGANPLGAVAGAVVAGTWAFLQPVLIYLLIFGSPLAQAAAQLGKSLGVSSAGLLQALLVLGVVKLALSALAASAAYALPEHWLARYEDAMKKAGAARAAVGSAVEAPKRAGAPDTPETGGAIGWRADTLVRAFKDLLHPLFLASLALTLVFFIWVEAPASVLIWGVLRPLAAGFLVFWLLRVLPLERLIAWLEGSRKTEAFGRGLRTAVRTLREI